MNVLLNVRVNTILFSITYVIVLAQTIPYKLKKMIIILVNVLTIHMKIKQLTKQYV